MPPSALPQVPTWGFVSPENGFWPHLWPGLAVWLEHPWASLGPKFPVSMVGS